MPALKMKIKAQTQVKTPSNIKVGKKIVQKKTVPTLSSDSDSSSRTPSASKALRIGMKNSGVIQAKAKAQALNRTSVTKAKKTADTDKFYLTPESTEWPGTCLRISLCGGETELIFLPWKDQPLKPNMVLLPSRNKGVVNKRSRLFDDSE